MPDWNSRGRMAKSILELGGLTPMVVSLLMKWDSLGPAYYVASLCGVAMLIGLFLIAKKR